MTDPTAQKPPAEAVPAATILLLRDHHGGPPPAVEVLMVQRHQGASFAPNALVFPGGKVDKADSVPAILARLKGGEGESPLARALRVAAIREAFEESGLLLARPRGHHNLIGNERAAALESARIALNAGSQSFLSLLEAEDLELAGDLLVPFANWVTPRMAPKRFDTHFFLAPAPTGQVAAHDGGELVDSVWVRPAEGLADAKSGRRPIMFPTQNMLLKLCEVSDKAHALDGARHRPIVPVEPWMEQRSGKRFICIRKDAGFSMTEIEITPGLIA